VIFQILAQNSKKLINAFLDSTDGKNISHVAKFYLNS